MLELNNVHTGYGRAEIIRGVSLTVRKGEIVTLIGANGAGKTTILRAICGAIRTREGTILHERTEIQNMRSDQICDRGISMIPEGRQLFPHLSVRDNLLLGAYRRAARPGHLARIEKVLQLFPKLKQRLNVAAGSLSGGEQQMAAIGRGLMSDPRLLIFDEPSLGLSPLLVSQMFEIVRKVADAGVTVLVVEQNIVHTLEICDRGYVLENGVIVLTGDGKSLKNDSMLKQAYLGR